MDFAILGPLEVRHDGRPVPIAGRHAPKLLAVLLLDADRLVTVNRLIEAAWGETPPATARRQVRNVMAALRRALPQPEAIEAGANGYRFVVDGNTLDQREFERLRAEARQSEPRQAARQLADALRLWRGSALSGLAGTVIEAAAAKLDEERLSVVEDRVELEFGLDRNGDAAAELHDLVEAHPYRQRLAGLLMRAHWYAGRTPDALAVYERLRENLAEDLGLDPAPELARLHTAILRREPDSDPPRTPVTGPVPAQLPAAPTTFTGRREHVTELDELLEQGGGTAVVSAIAGMGGAGKTALALHWGHRVRDRFPDGQLYINLRGYDDGEPVAPIDALGRFLVALGRSSASVPSSVEEAAALYRSLVAKRRMLVVLDNAREANQVRPLLPGGAGNFALVTSRDRLASLMALDDARPIRLDPLSHAESVELLANIVGARRLHAEPEATHDLARLCGHLPLALRIAGAQIATDSTAVIADFTAQLDRPDRVDRLAIGEDTRAAVAHSLELSFGTLGEPARMLVLRLALIPGSTFSHSLAIQLSDLDADDAERALSRLVSSHLLEQHDDNRYRFHDLVRVHTLSRGAETLSPQMRDQVQERLIDWYDSRINSLPAEEGTNVLAAVNAWEHLRHAWKLVLVASSFWRKGVNPTALLDLCRRSIPVARDSADPDALPRMYNSIAILHRGLGEHLEATDFARRALCASEDAGVGDVTGRFHLNLAICIDELGRVGESVPLFRQALRNATRVNYQPVLVNACAALGNAYRILGEFAEAERFLRQAIALEDSDDVNVPRFQLGVLFIAMGRLHDAARETDLTIAEADRVASIRYQVLARIRRAGISQRLGDYDDARGHLDRSIELSVRNCHENLAVDVRIQLADLLQELGRNAEALEQLGTASSRDSDEPDAARRAEVSRIRGLVSLNRGDSAEAITLLTSAHDLYASMPSPLMLARVLTHLGSASQASGDIETARRHRLQALEIFTRLDVPEAAELREFLNPAP